MPTDVKGMLTARVGPLPVYAYVGIGLTLWYVHSKKKAGTQASPTATTYPVPTSSSPIVQLGPGEFPLDGSYGAGGTFNPGPIGSTPGSSGTPTPTGSNPTPPSLPGPLPIVQGGGSTGEPSPMPNPHYDPLNPQGPVTGGSVAPQAGPSVYPPAGEGFAIGPSIGPSPTGYDVPMAAYGSSAWSSQIKSLDAQAQAYNQAHAGNA